MMMEDTILLFSSVFTYLIVLLPYYLNPIKCMPFIYHIFPTLFVNVLVGRVKVRAGGGAHWLLSTPWWHRMAVPLWEY